MWWLRSTARRSEVASIHGAWRKVGSHRSTVRKGQGDFHFVDALRGHNEQHVLLIGLFSLFIFASVPKDIWYTGCRRTSVRPWRMWEMLTRVADRRLTYLRMSSSTHHIFSVMVNEAWYSWERETCFPQWPPLLAECINYLVVKWLVKVCYRLFTSATRHNTPTSWRMA